MPRLCLSALFAAVGAFALPGCAENGSSQVTSAPAEYAARAVAPAPAGAAPAPAAGADTQQQAAAEAPPAVPRKIIYNARIELAVENLAKFRAALDKLVTDSGSYLANSDESSDTQEHRSSTWTVRVPAERVRGFVDGIARLGEPQRNHLDSQDVTQEYYDVEARIKNKQEEERRLLKHLADSTGRLEDILAVERELTRVRGEVEQMQGRLRFLANVTSFGTVVISATEIKNYTPPVAPTFATQVARTFLHSTETIVEFGKGLILIAAAILPWLPILLAVGLLVLFATRRSRARRPRGNPIA